MHLFLYTATGISALTVIALVNRQSKKYLTETSTATSKLDSKCFALLAMDLLIGLLIMILITFLLPYIIWTLGPKEVGRTEIIKETKSLYPHPGSTTGIYLKENISAEKPQFIANTGKTKYEPFTLNIEKTEVIYTKRHQSPKYQKIFIVEIYKLRRNDFITSAVNSIYANAYIHKNKTVFIEEKLLILIPRNAIEPHK